MQTTKNDAAPSGKGDVVTRAHAIADEARKKEKKGESLLAMKLGVMKGVVDDNVALMIRYSKEGRKDDVRKHYNMTLQVLSEMKTIVEDDGK